MLTPLIVTLLLFGGTYILLVPLIFSFAVITDYFDGHYARKFNAVSKSGSFLDAFADKVLLLSLFYVFYTLKTVHLWMIVSIAVREIFITCLRLFMIHIGMPLQTIYLAKIKTMLQMFAVYLILGFLCCDIFTTSDKSVFSAYRLIKNATITYTMYLVVFVTIYSGILYLVKNRIILLSTKKLMQIKASMNEYFFS